MMMGNELQRIYNGILTARRVNNPTMDEVRADERVRYEALIYSA